MARQISVLKLLQSFFLLLLGVGILIYTLRRTESDALKSLWPRLNGIYVAALCALIVLSHVLRALRWRQLFTEVKNHPRLWTSFISLMAGYLANLIPPRAGEVIRAALLARFEKIPVERVFGTVLSERAVDVITLMVLFVPPVLLSGNELDVYLRNHVVSALYQKSNALSLRMIIFIALLLILGGLLVTFWGRKKIKVLFLSFWQGFSAVLHLNKPWKFWLYTFLIWFCYWAIIILGWLSLQIWPHEWLVASLALMTAGTIGMIVTPGGTIYPILCSGILALFGVIPEDGLLMGWLLWGSQMIIFIVFGAIAFVTLPFVKRT